MPQRWDIWWARWRNADGSIKERFVLVLGSVEGDFLCSYISSRCHKDRPHLVLAQEHSHFLGTGLHVTSYLYVRDYQRLSPGDLLYRAGLLLDSWREDFMALWQGR